MTIYKSPQTRRFLDFMKLGNRCMHRRMFQRVWDDLNSIPLKYSTIIRNAVSVRQFPQRGRNIRVHSFLLQSPLSSYR